MDEAIRPTHGDEKRIIVNGKTRIVTMSHLSYEAVCQLAGEPEGATVIWDSANGLKHRSLFKSDPPVEVEPLMRFTAIMTDKA